MAASMAIIEMSDIPIAVLNALLSSICFHKINVSNIIEVIKPFIIARVIIAITGHSIPEN